MSVMGFQEHGESPHLPDSKSAHDGLLRFTSGAQPADLLAASMTCSLNSDLN